MPTVCIPTLYPDLADAALFRGVEPGELVYIIVSGKVTIGARARDGEPSGRGMFHQWLSAIMATLAMHPRFRRR